RCTLPACRPQRRTPSPSPSSSSLLVAGRRHLAAGRILSRHLILTPGEDLRRQLRQPARPQGEPAVEVQEGGEDPRPEEGAPYHAGVAHPARRCPAAGEVERQGLVCAGEDGAPDEGGDGRRGG